VARRGPLASPLATVLDVVDALFSDPRLAALYDDFDGARDDLDHYQRMIGELGACNVLDIGCGTGSFAKRGPSQMDPW